MPCFYIFKNIFKKYLDKIIYSIELNLLLLRSGLYLLIC